MFLCCSSFSRFPLFTSDRTAGAEVDEGGVVSELIKEADMQEGGAASARAALRSDDRAQAQEQETKSLAARGRYARSSTDSPSTSRARKCDVALYF